MNLELIALIVVVLAHIVATVWWAATITANLKNIKETLITISYNDAENGKMHALLWKRQDDLGNRMTAMETKCAGNHKE